MNKIHIQYYKTALSEFIMGSYEGKLCMLDYRYRKKRESVDKRLKSLLNAEYVLQDDVVLKETRTELDEYFRGERKEFTISLLMVGSSFQKSVWRALLKVPFGETLSYLELSQNIGNEKAVRTVANANGANAIAIIIPCHRIIGKNGKLTGYAGGLELKQKLLHLENNLFTESI